MTSRLLACAVGLLIWTGAREGGGGGGGGGGASYYVSPSGSGAGDGSQGHPWDLATALAGARSRVAPGDTIWLRGGTYRSASPYQSTLRGAPGAPVVVRQYRGERATIDAAGATSRTVRGDLFVVSGDYTVFWGFELMDSDPDRTTDTRPNMVVNNASHTRYVNLVVHDGGIGFYTYAEPTDVEVSGCLFYNNGWEVPRQANGHAIYAKSYAGPVVLRDNIAFDQFGYGLHVYTEARSGLLNNIRLEGNVLFNNGTLSAKSGAANILVGGRAPADGIVAQDNVAYFSPGVTQTNAVFGWRNARGVRNGTLLLSCNYLVGGGIVLDLHGWARADVSANTVYGPAARPVVEVDAPSDSLDATNHVLAAPPQQSTVFVRANPYEKGRANITVYNWAHQDTVAVALAQVLVHGDAYAVYNAQDFFGQPVVRGVYTGAPLRIPMAGVTPPGPIGGAPQAPPPTGSAFGVFVVTRFPR
ncbi:MAG TPA: hypothetical protein VFD76_02355 [Gemmatimonadales bacterium]|nr:hypothetical protein [Gemmatimonadales bacterium]